VARGGSSQHGVVTLAIAPVAASLRAAIAEASAGLVEREVLVELVALAAVAGEHVLVIGPPGTAKSEAVRRIAGALEGKYFEYLLGRFTEPNEIFGPVDLRRLREGVVETETRGMLPEAEIAFLDEVFLGSTAILNTLLTILNERTFRRGHTSVRCPLRVCVGASNHLPDDDLLAAFADRFLLHAYVEPVADSRLEELLEGAWRLAQSPARRSGSASVDQLDALAEAARAMDLTRIRPVLAHGVRLLRAAGIALTDRRVAKTQRLVAAAAALAGRSAATDADLWPVVYAVPTPDAQRTARDALRDLLGRADNPTVPAAAEEATAGPLLRARRLASTADGLLSEISSDSPVPPEWRLRLEGVAREIDAAFSDDTIPDELRATRKRIVDVVRGMT
jgi:MoxR-like ATPase